MLITRRTFIKGTAAALAGGTFASSAIYASTYGRHDLECTRVPLQVGLNRPFRLVALGDIHFDPLYEEAYLTSVMSAVTALQPDLVIYTGDFITNHRGRLDDLGRLVTLPITRHGCFAVVGNHDNWAGLDYVMPPLESRGIRFLRNEAFALQGEEDVFLTGIDSFWAGYPDLTVFDRTPKNSRHIVVVHEPDAFAIINDPRIKLQISGHTHGGQVRLPLAGPLALPKWGKEYDEGLFRKSERRLYVNRGIGTLRPHVRFDCRPEITLFELT